LKTIKFVLLPAIISFFIIYALIGCSGGGNPAAPDYSPDRTVDPETIPTAISTGENSFEGLMGLYNLSIDTSFPDAEISPLRMASAKGDSYQVDVTSFFNVRPCHDCLGIAGVEIESDGTLTVRIGARHPFPLPLDMQNIQQNERLDLHIFDVQGILIMDGSSEFPFTKSDVNADESFSETIISSADLLRNADGYTSIHDTFFDTISPTVANIHPFKIFAKDGSEGNYNPTYDPNNGYPYLDYPTGHNVFRQGSPEYIVDYNLDLPPGSYDFLFALSASYGQSGQRRGLELGQLGNPRYFLPEFNRKEPWMVTVDITNNTLKGSTPSTSADLNIEIRDWQQTAVVDPNFDFFYSPLSATSRSSRIREVTVEIPGFQKYYDYTNLPTHSGNGSDTSPYRYQFRIYNDALVDEGMYLGLVAVRDDLEGSLSEMGVQRDGVTLFLINDFTTYQVFRIDVASSDFPPIAAIQTIPDPAFVQENEQPITFDGSPSSDDSLIVSYEWDFDYTGSPSLFHTDATGALQNHTYATPGFYQVALRVTDNHVPPQQDLDTVEVRVFCGSYTVGTCPINSLPTWLVTSHNESWETEDGKTDFGFMSNGDIVIEDDEILGHADISPSGGAPFIPFVAGYPGNNIGSIDVDRHDRVLWVDYSGPDVVVIGGVEYRNSLYGKILHVFDTTTHMEIATTNLGQFGSHIQAVETDEADNAWVIMDTNLLLKCRASDYAIVQTNVYDLNDLARTDIGFVFDMIINFHNDCFYVLTNKDDKGSVYRFECDLTYKPIIDGNPNPLNSVFQTIGGFPLIEVFGDDALADIEIDNFTGPGYNNIHTGKQDCEIVLIANGLLATTQIFAARTIINADLEILAKGIDNSGYGTHAIGIIPDGTNYIYSIVYGNQVYLPPGCSDKELDVYTPPTGWQ
jgi:hypothetical protein